MSTIFKQNIGNINTTQQQVQVKQVGSFTIDSTHNGAAQSPTGNVFVFNTFNIARRFWILDSGTIDHVCTSLFNFTFVLFGMFGQRSDQDMSST